MFAGHVVVRQWMIFRELADVDECLGLDCGGLKSFDKGFEREPPSPPPNPLLFPGLCYSLKSSFASRMRNHPFVIGGPLISTKLSKVLGKSVIMNTFIIS